MKTGRSRITACPNRCHPKTFEVDVDKYTDHPGIHPGQHGLFIDQITGYVYSTGTWNRSIARLDPKTGEIRSVVTDLPENGNMALEPDGKSIWRTDPV